MWRCDQLHATVDLQHLTPALGDVAFHGQRLRETALLQMRLEDNDAPMQLDDHYIRGNDLIANYSDAAGYVRREFYWRIMPGQGAQAGWVLMEALVSARTDLLDSNPTVDVRCTLPAESCAVLHEPDAREVTEFAVSQGPATLDIDTGSPHALSFRLAQSRFVFAQLLPAADVVHAELASESVSQTITSTVSFFGGRVEKGVIRRARLRAFLAPQDGARRVLGEQWGEMLAAPPPLAT